MNWVINLLEGGDAKKGKIVDAEDDAVCMKNLVEKRDKYFQLRHRWDLQ